MFDQEVQREIAARLDRVEIPPEVCAADDLIQSSTEVRDFYRKRGFAPAWSRGGRISSQTAGFLKAVRAAGEEGLEPSDYHLAAVERLLDEIGIPDKIRIPAERIRVFSDLDLLFTDAFFLFASHLADGKVEPNEETSRWDGRCASADLDAFLQDALSDGDLSPRLGSLVPQHAYYARLKRALAAYRARDERGGWRTIPFPGSTLRIGDRGVRVSALRERLRAEGYLGESEGASAGVFDDFLEAAVCAFQERHGLPQSGIVDPPTLTALNVPARERLLQIRANLERWRWLRPDLGARYAFVDAAAFEMFVVENAREVLRMKIVAGTPAWQTPVFSSVLTEVVVNPSWYAPPSILLKELIAYIKADPEYLSRNKMKLFRGWGADEVELDPRSVDLDAVTKESLDFRLVQAPGPLNIVGRLKFTHPNRYNVFLHDTPYQSDFGLAQRTASHGCVRIERPVDFALFLLGEPKKWTAEKVQELIETEREMVFKLDGLVAAHVFYGTAWAGEDGAVSFRPDIYFLDAKLSGALVSPASRARRAERMEFKDGRR